MNKLVGKLALVNDYKHRYSSQFHLAPSLKGMYPVHLNEEAKLQLTTQDDESTCMFRIISLILRMKILGKGNEY